jgi:hypothetical protein
VFFNNEKTLDKQSHAGVPSRHGEHGYKIAVIFLDIKDDSAYIQYVYIDSMHVRIYMYMYIYIMRVKTLSTSAYSLWSILYYVSLKITECSLKIDRLHDSVSYIRFFQLFAINRINRNKVLFVEYLLRFTNL